jgi:hypothetical protein
VQNLGSRDISQAGPFGDTSDEITGIPVICEYTMSNQVTPSPPVLFEAFPGPNQVISGMVDFL